MFIRSIQSFVVACLFVGSLSAAEDPFVGKWKFNPDKSKLTGEQEKIEDLGSNKYRFCFGNDCNMVVADGTDQPTKYGDTWSLKSEGQNSWKFVRKRDGKTLSTEDLTISDDGKMLTGKVDGTREDGSTFNNEFKAKRINGTSGLAGTWESTELKLGSATEWDIEAYDDNGLSFITPAEKERLDMKFDGKDYTPQGPRVAPDSSSSGRRIDQHTLEVTDKLKGKVMGRTEYKVSEDGRTLTLTAHYPGVKTPQIIVYDRQ